MGMGFFDIAWRAAAEAYGASRAEKYGKVARAWRVVQMLMVIVLILAIVWAANSGAEG